MAHLVFELGAFLLAAFVIGCILGCLIGRWMKGPPKGADDLQKLSGVGPVLERKLHNAGVTTFRQIAAWKPRDIAEFNKRLDFVGRIEREGWVAQAKLLCAGRHDEFERLYGSGGQIDPRTGRRRAGARTRRR